MATHRSSAGVEFVPAPSRASAMRTHTRDIAQQRHESSAHPIGIKAMSPHHAFHQYGVIAHSGRE
jgi:hypothetical protein